MNAQEERNRNDYREPKRGKKPPAQNPIEAALTAWLRTPHSAGRDRPDAAQLLAQAPKRWTVYEPMVLLPAGAFGSPAWRAALAPSAGDRDDDEGEEAYGCRPADELWEGTLAEISKRHGARLTHLAANEGIPLHKNTANSAASPGKEEEEEDRENILRSPSGLRTLYGDFGPATAIAPPGAGESGGGPTAADFEAAFWVSTRQNGIFQTWAPRWTMFSRGNIKEKARLLGFHNGGSGGGGGGAALPKTVVPRARVQTAHAVDLYAGIGYFAFSYARLGMRVLCWELNPWSVEGLRRGALGNGWTVRVVRGDELTSSYGPEAMRDLLAGGEQIVVFQEDNKRAAERIAAYRRQRLAAVHGDGGDADLDVLHVNCGLLPASDASWKGAWDIVAGGSGGGRGGAWLHLHENVGAADIESRRGEIERWFSQLAEQETGKQGEATSDPTLERREIVAHVDHVERVKTFAPGVWHCVFDLYMVEKNRIT